MHFDKKSLKHLSHLCRIECTEEEIDQFLINLESVLSHVDQMNEIDTRGVEPCIHVDPAQTMPLEEDEERDTIDRETLLQNAPDAIAGMVRVPPIMNS